VDRANFPQPASRKLAASASLQLSKGLPVTAPAAVPSNRPLVVTSDPQLLDDLLRLAAAAGVEPVVCADIGAATALWRSAPAVIVGFDVIPSLQEASRRAAPARRPGVVLVGSADRADELAIWRLALDLGAESVLFLPDAESALIDLFADRLEQPVPAAAQLAVVGGRGGAGATSLAVAVALAGVRADQRVLLVDGDPLGGGIDLALGAESLDGMRWSELRGTHGRVSGAALTDALPAIGELTVLSWDRGDELVLPAEAAASVLDAGRRSSDLVIVDLPRHVDAAAAAILQATASTYVVVPSELRAAAAAARVITAVAAHCADVRAVVRLTGRTGSLGAESIAASLGLPLAGSYRSDPALPAALDRGEPPGLRPRSALGRLADTLVRDVLIERRRAA
jgi:secretion/DNA translocation related CpaE-like protein